MAQHEHSVNNALGACLRKTRHVWRKSGVVKTENTSQLLEGDARVDVLIAEPEVSPVAIEVELMPATKVEEEALARLGKHLRKDQSRILSAIAVRLPDKLRKFRDDELADEIAKLDNIELAIYTGAGAGEGEYERWPLAGWLKVDLPTLSVIAQSAALPPVIVKQVSDQLMEGVGAAAGILDGIAADFPGATSRIAEELRQPDEEQTRKMAATILANAFVFHGNLAGRSGALKDIRPVSQLRDAGGVIDQVAVLDEWQRILKINYWPIFHIASEILKAIPPTRSALLLQQLEDTASKLLQNKLMRSHDLTGAVFQRMIIDRKFLAAFYTTPSASSLLVNLVLHNARPLKGAEWGDDERVTSLRIADMACGTGTLLSTAYQHIGQLHELHGGDSEELHARMMANSLIGIDILPAAAHLTASMLAGVHPTVQYTDSLIDVAEYGIRKGQNGKLDIRLGSIDLLHRKASLLGVIAKRVAGTGGIDESPVSIPDNSLDVVLMNPPFTRQTGEHEFEGEVVDNPMFAAFGASKSQQQAMAAEVKKLLKAVKVDSAHGNAGEASIFLALADMKLKLHGLLGLVMPLSLLSGESWEGSRALLRRNYANLILISISGAAGKQLAFSADTGMGECLVIAKRGFQKDKRATFVVLKERPRSSLVGLTCATELHRLIEGKSIRKLEDGPVGGTPLHFGKDEIGWVLDAPLPDSGGWNPARIADLSLAQAAWQFADCGRCWLPGMGESATRSVPISSVGAIGVIGPLDRDINGPKERGRIRGPFDIAKVDSNSPVSYPVLWAHDADRERTMRFPHDSEARHKTTTNEAERLEIARKAEVVWRSASRCHFSLNFRFNSQSTSMQFTPDRTIGGRAWPTIQLTSEDMEKALVLWSNSTIGVLLCWWLANKQQSGRGTIVRTVLRNLPVLDVTALSKKQLAAAVRVFDETCDLPLLPVHQIDTDPNRAILDKRLGVEVLGLPEEWFAKDGPLHLLRRKLAAEPSIHGHKGRRKARVESPGAV